jgi:excisionase family DNA binding protein
MRWESLQSMAQRTGFSVKTFRNWISTGRFPLPLYRLRGEYRVQVEDVNGWVQDGKIALHGELR